MRNVNEVREALLNSTVRIVAQYGLERTDVYKRQVFWTVTEADGIYKPVYAVQSLPGAVFEIRAAADIYTLDGVMHYAKMCIRDRHHTRAQHSEAEQTGFHQTPDGKTNRKGIGI